MRQLVAAPFNKVPSPSRNFANRRNGNQFPNNSQLHRVRSVRRSVAEKRRPLPRTQDGTPAAENWFDPLSMHRHVYRRCTRGRRHRGGGGRKNAAAVATAAHREEADMRKRRRERTGLSWRSEPTAALLSIRFGSRGGRVDERRFCVFHVAVVRFLHGAEPPFRGVRRRIRGRSPRLFIAV